MGTFDRGLDDAFVELLNREYDRDDWWRGMVNDRKLFLAVRERRLNVYYRGCSLLRWDADSPYLEIHYKYLLRPDVGESDGGKWYVNVDIDGGRPIFPKDKERYFIENVTDLVLLKKAAEPYAGVEKTGVHEVVLKNKNILDVEIAQGNDRIDFVALQETGRVIALVFFEAKHFANSELRAKGDGEPKVVRQVKRYAGMLRRNRDAIRDSYRRVCKNLTELRGLAELNPKRHAMMKRIVNGSRDLLVDENPRLIVFGFDGDQKNGAYWKPHLRKLKDAIGKDRVLLKGDPKKFHTGISTGYHKK